MKTICLTLALIVVACGNGSDRGAVALSSPPASPGPGATPQTVAVRLLGVGASGPVRVRVAAVELSVDGVAVPAQVEGGELDLAVANAWEVATFDLPADAQAVAIKLRFQPGGVVERNGRAQALDLGGPSLSLEADAARIRARSKVVLEVDLARSLTQQCAQVSLLPDFTVRY